MSIVNWVVVGIGDIARKRVLPAILAEPRSALYGFVTRDKAKANDYPGAKAWSTLEEALQDNTVDAVYIALPVAMHADAANSPAALTCSGEQGQWVDWTIEQVMRSHK